MSCPQTSPCKMAAPPEHANAACKSAVKTAVCKLAQREGAAEEVKPGSRIDLVAEIHPRVRGGSSERHFSVCSFKLDRQQ